MPKPPDQQARRNVISAGVWFVMLVGACWVAGIAAELVAAYMDP